MDVVNGPTKVCKKCKLERPIKMYWSKSGKPHGMARCSECLNAISLAYYHKTKEHLNRKRRLRDKSEAARNWRARYCEANRSAKELSKWKAHLKKKYGITPDEYESMKSRQNGLCALCQRGGKKLHIDHCHLTGKVHGLLCNACNWAIGALGDDSVGVMRAVDYLERFEAS